MQNVHSLPIPAYKIISLPAYNQPMLAYGSFHQPHCHLPGPRFRFCGCQSTKFVYSFAFLGIDTPLSSPVVIVYESMYAFLPVFQFVSFLMLIVCIFFSIYTFDFLYFLPFHNRSSSTNYAVNLRSMKFYP